MNDLKNVILIKLKVQVRRQEVPERILYKYLRLRGEALRPRAWQVDEPRPAGGADAEAQPM